MGSFLLNKIAAPGGSSGDLSRSQKEDNDGIVDKIHLRRWKMID